MSSHLQHPIGSTATIRLRVAEAGDDSAGTVEIRSSRACGHVETMCSACQDQWRQDWVISNPEPAAAR